MRSDSESSKCFLRIGVIIVCLKIEGTVPAFREYEMMFHMVGHRKSANKFKIHSGTGSEGDIEVDACMSLDMRYVCGGRNKLKKENIGKETISHRW